MNNGTNTNQAATQLRWRAEEVARRKGGPSTEESEALSPRDMRRTLHELRVHQIELEMQNEELRRTQADLEAARMRYFDLYDLAPIGYCILSLEGLILEANLTAVTMLGMARAALIRQPITQFIFKEDQDLYYLLRKRFLESEKSTVCELRMMKKDGTVFWANMAVTVARIPRGAGEGEDSDGAVMTRVVLSDISERKRIEEEKIELEARLQQVQRHRLTRLKRGKDAIR